MEQEFSSQVFGFSVHQTKSPHCPLSTATGAAMPPGLKPQNAITGEKCLHVSNSLSPRPTVSNPLLPRIAGKLLEFHCLPCVEG